MFATEHRLMASLMVLLKKHYSESNSFRHRRGKASWMLNIMQTSNVQREGCLSIVDMPNIQGQMSIDNACSIPMICTLSYSTADSNVSRLIAYHVSANNRRFMQLPIPVTSIEIYGEIEAETYGPLDAVADLKIVDEYDVAALQNMSPRHIYVSISFRGPDVSQERVVLKPLGGQILDAMFKDISDVEWRAAMYDPD